MSNPLGELVKKTIETGEGQTMSDADRVLFHRQFAEDIGPWVDKHRTRQRLAYASARKMLIN